MWQLYSQTEMWRSEPDITAQCIRVPVLNGHTAAVFVNLAKKAKITGLDKSTTQRVTAFNNGDTCIDLNLCPHLPQLIYIFKTVIVDSLCNNGSSVGKT